MTTATQKVAVVDCDQDLFTEVATTLQHAITGKPVFYSDSLVDLVKRHCPQLHDICRAQGYSFIPSNSKDELMEKPPAIWFDIISLVPAEARN
jgi:hypothetical protein